MIRRRGLAAVTGFVCVLVALAVPVSAQSRFEVGAGATWTGGFDAGAADALLSRDATGGTTPLTLFRTSSRLESAPGVAVHASFFITAHVGLEARAEFSRPILRTTIANDFENATGTEATLSISSYGFSGSLVYRFGSRRLVPFALAGAGRLRQLDDERIMLVTGTEVHGGGGVSYRLTPHLGLRGDAMASAREHSIAVVDKRRVVPVVSGGISYRF